MYNTITINEDVLREINYPDFLISEFQKAFPQGYSFPNPRENLRAFLDITNSLDKEQRDILSMILYVFEKNKFNNQIEYQKGDWDFSLFGPSYVFNCNESSPKTICGVRGTGVIKNVRSDSMYLRNTHMFRFNFENCTFNKMDIMFSLMDMAKIKNSDINRLFVQFSDLSNISIENVQYFEVERSTITNALIEAHDVKMRNTEFYLCAFKPKNFVVLEDCTGKVIVHKDLSTKIINKSDKRKAEIVKFDDEKWNEFVEITSNPEVDEFQF